MFILSLCHRRHLRNKNAIPLELSEQDFFDILTLLNICGFGGPFKKHFCLWEKPYCNSDSAESGPARLLRFLPDPFKPRAEG
jgi:hypothetical protein